MSRVRRRRRLSQVVEISPTKRAAFAWHDANLKARLEAMFEGDLDRSTWLRQEAIAYDEARPGWWRA